MSLTTPIPIHDLNEGEIAIVGIPFDENSSFLRGPADGPAATRRQLHCGSANYFSESGHDLAAESRLHDVGDMSFPGGELWLDIIERHAGQVLETGAKLLSIGGDHSVTWPLVRAHARRHTGLTLLQIDAHPDLYDALDGNPHSHACPFARIMEEGLVRRLVQVGIRTLNQHQREQAARFGVEMIEMKDWSPQAVAGLDLSGPLYLSLDLDGIDPAFAPGVSHHEPGGLSSRDVISIIQQLPPVLVGADIVELNPTRDPVGITAMLSAKLLREVAAKLLQSN